MINNISATLKALMKQKEISSSELARCTGVAQPVIYRIASGETDNPKLNTVIPLAEFFGASIDNFIDGTAVERNTTHAEHKKTINKVPLLQWEQIKNKDLQGSHFWHATHSTTSESAFAFTITDDSFLPNFPAETIVIFDPSLPAKNEDVVLASYKKETPSIKRYLVDGGDSYLKPIRHELSAKLLDQHESLEILGVLVEATSFYKRNSDNKEKL